MAVSFELPKCVAAKMQCCYGTNPRTIAYDKLINQYIILISKSTINSHKQMLNKNFYKCLKQCNTGCENASMHHAIVFELVYI